MKRRPFTASYIRRLKPRDKRYEMGDLGSRGFQIRVGSSGVKTFCSVYRSRETGKKQRITLGEFGIISVEEARLEHAQVRLALKAGRDPAAERRGLLGQPIAPVVNHRHTRTPV